MEAALDLTEVSPLTAGADFDDWVAARGPGLLRFAYVRRMVVNAHTSWWRKFRRRESPVAEVRLGGANDPELRDEVLVRVSRLGMPSYTGFVQPRLEAVMGRNGAISDVTISYPMDLTTQMLEYRQNSPRRALALK